MADLTLLREVFEERADQPRWVAWREIVRDGESRKVPVNPHTGGNASHSDRETWGTLEEALRRHQEDGLDGVGIVLGGGLGGVDLDGCRDPETGELTDWAESYIEMFASYSEVSPSGTGVKVLALAAPDRLPASTVPMNEALTDRKRPALECYVSDRYFTITGKPLNGYGEIRETPEAWEQVAQVLEAHADGTGDREPREVTGNDEMSAALCFALSEDAKLKRLWQAGKGDGTDKSRNDASLAATLSHRGFEDADIEAALRNYPLGQIGTGKLAGEEADRQIGRLLGLAKGEREEPAVEDHPDPEILRGDEILAEGPPEQIEPMVPRFVWRRRLTIEAAREKTGKSSLTSYISGRFTIGGRVLGMDVPEPGTVLWITAPNEADRVDPVLDLQHFGGDPSKLYVLPQVRWLDDPLGEIRRAVEMVNPDMVVIDSLSSVTASLDLDVGDNTAWAKVLLEMQGIAKDHDVGILATHHGRRSDDKYRGAGAIGQSADVLLEMFKDVKGDPWARRISPKGRARRLATLELEDYVIRLEASGDDYTYLGDVNAVEIPLERRVVNYVEAHPRCSTRDVRENVVGNNQEVADILRDNWRLGVLERDDGPHGGYLWEKDDQMSLKGDGDDAPF